MNTYERIKDPSEIQLSGIKVTNVYHNGVLIEGIELEDVAGNSLIIRGDYNLVMLLGK